MLVRSAAGWSGAAVERLKALRTADTVRLTPSVMVSRSVSVGQPYRGPRRYCLDNW
jgi:hypothetical protein